MNTGKKEGMIMAFKVKKFLYLAIFIIILFTQFYHPVNGLADDQLGLVVAERVIQNITFTEGYKDLMERYIETGGLHPATAMGLPWINPFYTFITHSYSSLVGLSIPKWHFLSVLIFIPLLFFAYKLGTFFFGKYGFIFPLLLATNLYILVAVRNSIILFSLSLAVQFGAMYYFLKIHEKFEIRVFGLACLFLFLSLSNGSTYSPITYLYLVIILISLFAWKIINGLRYLPAKDFTFLKKKYYFLLFFAVPALSVISYFANDLLLNTPPGSSLDGFLYFTKSKLPPTEFPTVFDKLYGSFIKFKEVFLGTSFRNIFGPHATFFPYMTPVLDIAASFLFFLGILSFFKQFTYKKLILLAFLLYVVYDLYGVGAPRIFIVFIPFLLLISSAGFVLLVESLRALKFNRLISGFFLFTLGALLAYNVYFFESYFVVKSNSNLMNEAGISDVKDYLDSIKEKKILVFMATNYYRWYLTDFNKTDYFINNIGAKDDFRRKIEEFKQSYDEVVLIFPSGFHYVGNPGLLANGGSWGDLKDNYQFFIDAFPELVSPDKIVYDYQKIPQHYLYRLSKNRELPKTDRFVFKDPKEKLKSNFFGELQTIKITGGVKKIKFGDKEEIIINSSPSTDVTLNFGQDSFYNFYRSYSNDSFKENLSPSAKSKVGQNFSTHKAESLVWIEPNTKSEPPYLLEYLFNFPYKVKQVDIKNEARLFNSAGGQTAIVGYLVADEKHFNDYLKKGNKFSFLEIKSDDSNTYGLGGEANIIDDPWWGVGRLSSYKSLKPKNTKKLLISLNFKAYYFNRSYFVANLYSINNSSFFKFTLDTKDLPKPKIKEGESISIEKDGSGENPVVIDLVYR